MGKSLTGPTPREVLETPIFFTICLLSSSLTIHFAAKSLEHGKRARSLACGCSRLFWAALSFWHGAGVAPADLRARPDDLDESFWHDLLLAGGSPRISRHCWSGHAHDRVAYLLSPDACGAEQSARVEVLSMYWHFVDAVWVVVFTVVYVLGR